MRLWRLAKWLLPALGIGAIASLALVHWFPAPPSKVIIATAFKGASFEYYGKRYAQRFARAGVQLEQRETAGAVENLKLLMDSNSGVQIAFMTGGISNGSLAPGILSLGVVYNQPYWIFYSLPELVVGISQLKGKRIAVGPVGSGTRFSAELILGRGGVTSATATFLPLAGNAAVDALDQGKVDVVWIIGAPDATAVQSLLRKPNVRLMSFPMAEAFTRIYPDLVRLVLPQGVVDIDRIIPANDVPIVGTTTRVLIRNDLHPAIVQLLLETMIEEHSGPGIFQRVKEFPNANDAEYPLALSAVDYYKNGPSWLQRQLPLWLLVHVQRVIAVLVASLAIGIPLFGYAPKAYRWFIRERLFKFYRRLQSVEKALRTELSAAQMVDLQSDLDNLEKEVSFLWFPARHSDLFFLFRGHLNLTRNRLAARLK